MKFRAYYNCRVCGTNFGSNKGCATRTPTFCSRKCSAIYNCAQPSVKEKMSKAKIGIQVWNKGVKMWEGKLHPRGALGKRYHKKPESERITPINEAIRKSTDYKIWRKSVYERDNYSCQDCGTRGGKLHADHIKPFAKFPDLRLDLSNGRTLCIECHKKTDTYGGKIHKLIYAS